ncbi:MAG TPA: cytochrome c oxidase subunit II [Chloroflexota bacterium]
MMSLWKRAGPEIQRLVMIWLVLSVICSAALYFLLGPHLPPFGMSDVSGFQQFDNAVMVALVTPVIVFLATFFGYALVKFRHRGGAVLEDGPSFRGDGKTIGLWIAVTGLMVGFLAAWGSYELWPGEHGAGGGQGPDPITLAVPASASNALQVQVIGEQWAWTFRFPSYGGVETTDLQLPVNQMVEFPVTSIDVIHSFWAYELGVKADAVPGTDNIAFVEPLHTGNFSIRCAELCGLWHGHMALTGHVVSSSDFQSWINGQESQWAPITKQLDPYSLVYHEQPEFRAG